MKGCAVDVEPPIGRLSPFEYLQFGGPVGCTIELLYQFAGSSRAQGAEPFDGIRTDVIVGWFRPDRDCLQPTD